MGFTSLAFLVFFPIVLAVYLLLPGRFRAVWLLAASYAFCASFGLSYLLVLLGSTLVTWLCGLGIERGRTEEKESPSGEDVLSGSNSRGRLLFWAVIAFHVIALGFFKYNRLGLLLPVGISFYTFQAIGYLADVRSGKTRAERNLLNFALFQTFFPKLVQGPIERSGNLLAQIRTLPEKKLRDPERIRSGGLLLLWGLCEKLLIADRIAIPVNAVYGQFGHFGGVEIALTTVLYAFQIYCDFAGYTDIARGAAQMLGFELLSNFRRPYLADSIQDFWRRWHQSLSSWLRDYLYIPLGGSRKGQLRRAVNLMITFLVSGVWHGTGFHFLAWGGLHGLGQIAEITGKRLFQGKEKQGGRRGLPKFVKQILVFLFVDLTWMVFRANSIGDLRGMLWIIVTDFRLKDFAGMQLTGFEWLLILVGILAVVCKDLANERGIAFRQWILSRNAVCRCAIYTGLVAAIVILGVYGAAYDTSQFLYTQF